LKRCRLLLGWLLLVPAFGYCQQARLSGKVSLDSGWARKFYICRMPGFDYMFTTYSALIITEGDIDTAGNFSVNFPATKDKSLYRLHFIRKGDPAATLIIGNRDVNHVFFIAKQGDHIDFRKDAGQPIRQPGITGSKANDELNALIGLVDNDTTSNNALIATAGKSTSQLVGLLAISHTSGLNEEQKERVHDLLARYDQHNAYGAHIFREYKDTNYWELYLAGGILVIIVFTFYSYRLYKKRAISLVWRELSQREMDIVGLILSGKSNKEVALALSIELSTVKTHVNNIYAKLGVNNRKDLDRYKALISKLASQSVG
jgi:DNA-binding CsgD family transcriptional regulator